ncbi:MAG: dihydrofolate reductase [Bacilli bacterium]|nr:dihydrofolate reductase [Bacilli bacterium]
MENLALIVAVGKNNEIGYKNKLLWHLPNDLKYFKQKTLNKTIIMGRKTYESLPNKLPNRKHIIITKDLNYVCDEKICHTIKSVLDYIKTTKEECFIIGGSSIYKEFIPYTKYLYITKIEDTKEADVFFPEVTEENYHIELLGENEDNNIKYKFYKYIKKD